jgi:hypothetical protein
VKYLRVEPADQMANPRESGEFLGYDERKIV